MSDYFLGEIRIFPYSRVPTGWQICDGSLLQINAYKALYTLLGTQFGGNGTTTFGIPDLRGRTMVSRGDNQNGMLPNVGNAGGTNQVALSISQIPEHNHNIYASTANGTTANPTNAFLAVPVMPQIPLPSMPAPPPIYGPPSVGPAVAINSYTLDMTGGSQGHENRQPSIAQIYCISTTGIYPPRPN